MYAQKSLTNWMKIVFDFLVSDFTVLSLQRSIDDISQKIEVKFPSKNDFIPEWYTNYK